MDISQNPDYSSTDKLYKDKYVCVDCRKCFKRRVLSDFSQETLEKDPKCPDCGKITFWVESKFRPPKSDNLKAWNSVKVLHDIGGLSFLSYGNPTIHFPETNKGLKVMLMEMRHCYEQSIRRYISSEYDEDNKLQVGYLSEMIKKIDQHLNSQGF